MLSVIFYKLGAYFAARLPGRLSELITETLVRVQYPFRLRARRQVEQNLRAALGTEVSNAELHTLTRRTFSNFGRSIYYFLRAPAMAAGELSARCDTNGIDELAGKLAGGFVIVGPHLGAWEVGGACLVHFGLRIRTVALPHPSNEVTRFFDRHRGHFGVESESLNGSVKLLHRVLNGGGGVALLVDRPYSSKSEVVPWFGRETLMPIGHVTLAVRCGVPIVTCVCALREDGGFKLDWRGPYYPNPALDDGRAVEELRDICLRDMEAFIRMYPDQWFNFRPGESQYP